jgi:homoaconitase/3-isopropylmalate dehydratase large subunit
VLAYIEERRSRISVAEVKRNPYRMRDYTPIYPDADAVYDEVYTLDVSELQPQIALPHLPDNVVNLEQAIGTPIQQALIGTCTGGRLSDMQAAAEVAHARQPSGSGALRHQAALPGGSCSAHERDDRQRC